MAKPNCYYKRVQKHADKFNKDIERNKKLSNQFIEMCRCFYVNDLADKAEFSLPIMENLESGSSTYYETHQCKHKTKPRQYRLSMQSKSKGQNKQLPVSLSQKTQHRHSGRC